MKKFLALTLVVLLAFCSVMPMFAAEKKLSNQFDTLPAAFKNPTTIQLSKVWKDGASNAMHNTREGFDYIYLKDQKKGDFVVEFEVKEAGIYEFGFMLMGYKKGVPRTTNVQIDGKGDVYRMEYDYADANDLKKHYFYGIKQELTAGKHTVVFSLTADFDNSKVKSLYIQDFFYEKTGDIQKPAATTNAKPATPSAPATFDAGILAVVCAGVSLAGAVVCRKKK
ncbi:MAG: hypothetical protein E7662_03910 [Ruminococcaceae bacterium]|nr:hypothetical protein [Oscillospiraceae bacterium]